MSVFNSQAVNDWKLCAYCIKIADVYWTYQFKDSKCLTCFQSGPKCKHHCCFSFRKKETLASEVMQIALERHNRTELKKFGFKP